MSIDFNKTFTVSGVIEIYRIVSKITQSMTNTGNICLKSNTNNWTDFRLTSLYMIRTSWADPAGVGGGVPRGSEHKYNVSLLVETSSWLELVMFVKQIQTANICLNVERYCISVIVRAKDGPPLEKIPGYALVLSSSSNMNGSSILGPKLIL